MLRSVAVDKVRRCSFPGNLDFTLGMAGDELQKLWHGESSLVFWVLVQLPLDGGHFAEHGWTSADGNGHLLEPGYPQIGCHRAEGGGGLLA